MKINREKLNKIFEFNENSNDFITFLLEYDNQEIESIENWKPTGDEKTKIIALNQACKKIMKILRETGIELSIKKIEDLINKRIIKSNEYPNVEKKD